MNYAAALARRLGVGEKAWHLVAWHYGWSDSKSYASMTKFVLSEAITAAKHKDEIRHPQLKEAAELVDAARQGVAADTLTSSRPTR